MSRPFKIAKRLRSKLFYDRPVYVPGYEYSPWKTWLPIVAVGLILLLILVNFLSSNGPETGSNQPDRTSTTTRPGIAAESATLANPSMEELYTVARVIDGDTIEVQKDGKTDKVRLIGVDTPESVDPRKIVECFAREASNYTKSQLTGKKVRLEADTTQDNTDKYDRLLRYVFLETGENFNKQLIAEGYAFEYTYNIPYKYQTDFKSAQNAARQSSKGLWASTACSGTRTSTAPASVTQPTASRQDSTTGPSSDAYFANCSDARASGAAPLFRGEAGYRAALDRDNDGVACE